MAFIQPPENTHSSLVTAMNTMDGVEFDLRLTADEQLIVHHDDTVSIPKEDLDGRPKYLEEWDLDDLLEVSSENFFPHISLFYGLKHQAVKQAVIEDLHKLPEHLVLDKITIAETGQGDIESWKIIRQYPLINNLNVRNSLGRPL